MERTLGGDRLGSGKKQKVYLNNFERSTHDLSNIWKSTASVGTLIPFMQQIGLPGDSFEIDLNADVMTYPTLAPLFSSMKLQLDLFLCPIRLYQAQLHNNALGIGLDMSKIKLPQIEVTANNLNYQSLEPLELQQISQSSLLSYLGIRGLGHGEDGADTVTRNFNATSILAYYDIYKNYYANKQEEIGAYIDNVKDTFNFVEVVFPEETGRPVVINEVGDETYSNIEALAMGKQSPTSLEIKINAEDEEYYEQEAFLLRMYQPGASSANTWRWVKPTDIFNKLEIVPGGGIITYKYSENKALNHQRIFIGYKYESESNFLKSKVKTFPLENIDNMRDEILANVKNKTAYVITRRNEIPYKDLIDLQNDKETKIKSQRPQQGLALKTYQSDIFNNWISTEWLENEDGTGINQITAVSTENNEFQIDTLILAKKVYDMLNRIAVSGGTYKDWLEAVYDHTAYRGIETPMYLGGMSSEIVFQEVVSNAASEDKVLGDIAGKGVLAGKKGGHVKVNIDEPSIIIGIVSITPRLDYSQGNDWHVNLKTLDDLHKPSLDGIGFQDLITDKIAFWDTKVNEDGTLEFNTAGKQPAWIDYMTNYNRNYGNFADVNKEMFMTLNRRYEPNKGTKKIKDLTSYIDPQKFNYMFSYTERDAQNYWVQIATDIKARRKMSAKVIPNL